MQKDRYQWVLEWWGRARDDLETERETWRIKTSLAGAQAATEFYNEVWEIGIPTEWDQSHYTSSILSFPVLDKTETLRTWGLTRAWWPLHLRAVLKREGQEEAAKFKSSQNCIDWREGGRARKEGRRRREDGRAGFFYWILCVCVYFIMDFLIILGMEKCVFFNMHITELVRQLTGDRKIIGH